MQRQETGYPAKNEHRPIIDILWLVNEFSHVGPPRPRLRSAGRWEAAVTTADTSSGYACVKNWVNLTKRLLLIDQFSFFPGFTGSRHNG